jgi:amino acid adenylation domain-containing protein
MSDSLYGLLQRAATQAANHPAIVFRGRTVSYGELLAASDRAATLLARHGAQPGRRAAFCFRKSPEALMALFGLIRTGVTYVPLDPAWPAERIETICREANIELWVGNVPPGCPGIKTAILAAPCPASAVALDAAAGCEPARNPPLEPSEGTANILYTSGSTGQPKGIQITTRSLLHFARWAVDYFGVRPADRVANHAPYNFDLSTLDIFAAVDAGATMCPVPESIKVLPYQMARFVADQQITVWYSVPFALAMMVNHLGAHDLSRLRHVIFAGEVMPKPVLQALARALPRAAFTNLYGPTETNVCTEYRVDEADLADEDPLPIGRAIADTRVWIVNEEGGLISDDQTGELIVAGPTVTSGYFDDAELTARRLVLAPDGQGLAYRTGDLVSRRVDQVLRFHGRCDRMIKCRGYRIEPGEIEAVLCRHPRVKEAAVFRVSDATLGDQLQACIGGDPKDRPSSAELAAVCRQSLPVYMVPELWQFHDELPRTDRGKIDLQRLQQSEGSPL